MPIHHIIEQYKQFHIIFSSDITTNINTGFFIIKNTIFSKKILNKWAHDEKIYKLTLKINNKWHDQNAIIYMVNHNIFDIKNKSIILSYGTLQNFNNPFSKEFLKYNSLVCHLENTSTNYRYNISKKYYETFFLEKNKKLTQQQPDPTKIPRYCGFSTFARLNILHESEYCDIGIVGIPFDSGVTFRPGARFGPESIRSSSRLLRHFSINSLKSPFQNKLIKDTGDISCNPFNIHKSLDTIYDHLNNLFLRTNKLLILGGDHTISYPILKSVNKKFGKVALFLTLILIPGMNILKKNILMALRLKELLKKI